MVTANIIFFISFGTCNVGRILLPAHLRPDISIKTDFLLIPQSRKEHKEKLNGLCGFVG